MLRLESLAHSYPHTDSRALSIGDLTLEAGDQVLLRGVSGSGKTTLLHIVAGLLQPSEGRVVLGDRALYEFSEAARDKVRGHLIGYVLQHHHLLQYLSALENVIAPMAFAGKPPRARTKRARQLLEAVGLAHLAHRLPAQLSTGQRQRVAIARALANAPKLLLADEPTAALDSEIASAMIALLRRAAHEFGGVLIVASHDPALEVMFPLTLGLQQGSPPQLIRHAEASERSIEIDHAGI